MILYVPTNFTYFIDFLINKRPFYPVNHIHFCVIPVQKHRVHVLTNSTEKRKIIHHLKMSNKSKQEKSEDTTTDITKFYNH